MCRWVLMWASAMSLVVAIPEEHQYCAVRYRRLCQGKGRHIACQFPDSGAGPSCERYTQIKFTNDLKHFVTHYLNRRRQRVAAGNERVRGGVHLPKPQIMMLVEWDRELALLAQRLADQCHFVHDDCRATVRYPYAGQTVGEVRWRRSSDSDELSAQRAIRRVLDAWWGERRRVQPKQLTAPFRLTAKGTVWGHFSQLAVWNLQAVGCGAVRHGAHHPRLLLVCDFSHTNMLGQRTLVAGPAAPCPIHTIRRPRTAYPLLCAPVRHPVPAEPEEVEMEDNYEDEDEEDTETTTPEVADVPTPSVWHQKTNRRKTQPVSTSKIREFPEEVTRKVDIKMLRGPHPTTSTTKEPENQKPDLELDVKIPNREFEKNERNREMDLRARNREPKLSATKARNRNLDPNARNREQEAKARNREQEQKTWSREEEKKNWNREPEDTSRNREMEQKSWTNEPEERTGNQEMQQISWNREQKEKNRNQEMEQKSWNREGTDEQTRNRDLQQNAWHQEVEEREKTRNKVNANYKEVHSAFDHAQFDKLVNTDWRNRKKPNYGQWRQSQENPENLEEVIPLTVQRQHLENPEPTIVEIYRPTVREDSTERIVEYTIPDGFRPTIRVTDQDTALFRQRWRQTRVRPQRPGANALLYTSTGKNIKKEFIASLNLDKDDIDQLFRDTGFNIHWRKHTT